MSDVVLHSESVHQLAVVLFAPQGGVVLHLDEFGAHGKVVGTLRHAAGQHGTDAEFAAYRARVGLLAFVTKDCATRHYLEVGQLRETADQALGNAVAQVVAIRGGAGVDEGEHGQRVDAGGGMIAPVEEDGRGCEDCQDSHGDPGKKTPAGSGDCVVARYQALECERQVVGGMEALGGRLGKAPLDHPLEFGGGRLNRVGNGGWIGSKNRGHGLRRCVARKWAPARHHLVQNHAEREDVAGRAGLLAANLFRRHVAYGTHDLAGFGFGNGAVLLGRLGLPAGQAEVEDFDAAVAGEEDVARLDVAMDDALGVGGGQAFGYGGAEFHCLAPSERAAAQAVAEGLAFQQFGDGVVGALVLADVI
jgi:hypothetical protein